MDTTVSRFLYLDNGVKISINRLTTFFLETYTTWVIVITSTYMTVTAHRATQLNGGRFLRRSKASCNATPGANKRQGCFSSILYRRTATTAATALVDGGFQYSTETTVRFGSVRLGSVGGERTGNAAHFTGTGNVTHFQGGVLDTQKSIRIFRYCHSLERERTQGIDCTA